MNDALKSLIAKHPALFHPDANGDFPPGWLEIADRLLHAITSRLGPHAQHFRVLRVGEEHGTLDLLYSFGGDADLDNVIDSLRSTAERLSASTCQVCGAPGSKKRIPNHWSQTLCAEHTSPDMTDPLDEIEPNLKRLMTAHPLIFRGQPPAVPSYVSGGWYQLLDKLCTDIQAALGAEACAEFEVRQVKEKFGTLRFYYRFGGSADLHVDILSPGGRGHLIGRRPQAADADQVVTQVRELVAAACAASETICEQCGEPAELHNLGGYYTTLCELHKAEFLAKRGT